MKNFLLMTLLALGIPALCVDFTRSEHQPDLSPGTRKRVAAVPALYPEVQYKYGLFQNFLEMYIDRPLFFDRSLRPERFAYMTAESFFRDIEIMKRYGFDGSGSLAMAIMNLYKMANGYLDADPARARGHHEYPQFSFGEMGRFSADHNAYKNACEVLRIALKSPYTYRIGGKLPVSTYNSGYIKPAVMKEFLGNLRREFGDTFSVFGGLVVDHRDAGVSEWTPDIQQKYRERIREILDVYDGIQLSIYTEIRTGEYMTRADFRLYDRYLIPMVQEALAAPEFSGKLLGCSLLQGYVNHLSGVVHGEENTARLRGQLDRALKLNPDLIFAFEWNEFNENTCFQPTLTNSMGLQRIMRHYLNLLKGQGPEPNPGDDLNIPPLMLTHRETLKVGEKLEFELLNIPDTAQSATYRARLSLTGADGREVVRFPEETFDRAVLKAVTYSVPSEQLTEHVVLNPHLTVSGADGKDLEFGQFQYVRLLPTFCYNYKTVRQPLRDLIRPQQAMFSAVDNRDGTLTLSGSFAAGEPLAALEVTDYGTEFYAVDINNEFDREKNYVIQGELSTRANGFRQVALEVSDIPDWRFRPRELPNISFGNWTLRDGKMNSNTLVWAARTQFFIQVPKDFPPSATVRLGIDGNVQEFKLADLLKNRRYGQEYKSCRADWEVLNALPDIPVNIGRNEASFKVTLPGDHAWPILQMRAVTVSGKIYRGEPVIPRAIPEARCALNTVSETTGQVVGVTVPGALVPHIAYKIDPAKGTAMTNAFDPYFDAQLGGGFTYDEAGHTIKLPDESHAPEYVTDEGRPALKFNGSSSYINARRETFPRGPFTLKFSVKPDESDAPMILFRHYGWIVGSVTVYTRFDRLSMAFCDRELETKQFHSGFELPPGKWSTVEIRYDYRTIKFKINGRERVYRIDKPMQALYFKPVIWGGHDKEEFGAPSGSRFFRGLMRDFEIIHNAE